MPAITRKPGATSQLIDIFIPDATVSTGAGRANIVASTMTIGWYRSDMSAVSSWTLTTGTLGTWAASTMTQALSTFALGMYQVSLPDGLFASGTHAVALLSGPAGTAAPIPVLVDLSSYAIGVGTPVAVTTFALPVGVSSFAIGVGVSSFALPVGVSSFAIGVGVSSISVGVNASTVSDKTAYSLTANERASIADRFLGRNVSSGGDGTRTVSEALYVLRNKVDVTAGIVYATDDATTAWSFTASTLAGNPIVAIDPA